MSIMNTSSGIRKNYIYNLSYQIFQVIVPVITIPYISRVLGVENIGIYSYTSSVVTYFTMLAGFGTGIWGQREIAYANANNDRRQRTKIFCEIIAIKALLLVALVTAYLLFLAYKPMYSQVYKIQIISLINVFFDISWFFQGMEEFRKISVRNILIKVLGLFLTFALIHKQEDFLVYVWIQVLTVAIGNLSLWIRLPHYFCRIPMSSIKPLSNVSVLMSFFILQIAIQINGMIDKTLLGAIGKNETESGYYEQAIKIINLCRMIFTAFIIVLVPKMAQAFLKKDKKQLVRLVEKSCKWIIVLSCAISVGLFFIADNLVSCFLGSGYEKTGYLLKIYAFDFLFIPLSTLFGYLLVETQHQKQNTIGVLMCAVANTILSTCLIPLSLSVGATIATVFAELVGFLVHLFFVKEYIKFKNIVCNVGKFLIAAFVMGIFISGIDLGLRLLETDTVLITFIQIIVGGLFYLFIMTVVLKDRDINMELKKILRKVYRAVKNEQ